MTLTAYVGKKHGLVFPVMSNGYIKIPFDSQVRGFWDHDDSFTIETVITPYDVNGYGEERNKSTLTTNYAAAVSSKKVMPSLDQYTKDSGTPANYQDYNYITYSDRRTHKMMLFSNSKVQLYLQNTTAATNHNQPADYKIGFKVITTGSTKTIESSALISPRTTGYYNITDGVYTATNDELKYIPVTNDGSTKLAISGTADAAITVGDIAEEYVAVNQKLYTSAGVLIGTVSSLSSTTINFSADIPDSGVSGNVYTEAPKQAIYAESIFHIAATFDKSTGDMAIYINGIRAQIDTHANPDTFDWGQVDSYIGQDASLAQTVTKTDADWWVDTDGYNSSGESPLTQAHGTFAGINNSGSAGGTLIQATSDGSDIPLLDFNNLINGNPTIDFNDAGLLVFNGSNPQFNLGTNFDIILITKYTASDMIILGGDISGSANDVILFSGKKIGFREYAHPHSSNKISTNEIIADDSNYVIIRIKKTGNDAYLYNNGNLIETLDVTGLGTLNMDQIGCQTNDPSAEAGATINMPVIIIKESANFTDTQANTIQGELANKYNIPSTHNPWENAYRLTARNTQFMGQLHDFSITKGARKTFDTLYTLTPRKRDTLLYYRFEEVKNQ